MGGLLVGANVSRIERVRVRVRVRVCYVAVGDIHVSVCLVRDIEACACLLNAGPMCWRINWWQCETRC
jgi:hypothetical protein